MRQAEVQKFLEAQPFQPFRLFILETTAFDVRHSEFAFVTGSILHLTLSPGTAEEREVVIALVRFTRLEPILPAPSAPAGS